MTESSVIPWPSFGPYEYSHADLKVISDFGVAWRDDNVKAKLIPVVLARSGGTRLWISAPAVPYVGGGMIGCLVFLQSVIPE